MPLELDFSQPCDKCKNGDHTCNDVICGCIANHLNDDDIMRGFKVLKRALHPERESLTKGGWK